MQTGSTIYIYKTYLHIHHDMVYGKYNDLTKRIESDKVLRNKAFKIASVPKYDAYQRRLASMVFKLWLKKSSLLVDTSSKGSVVKSMSNQQVT